MPPLRDRMEIIEIAGYTEEEKTGHRGAATWCRSRSRSTGSPARSRSPRGSAASLVRGYTREAGVRNLEREIAARRP